MQIRICSPKDAGLSDASGTRERGLGFGSLESTPEPLVAIDNVIICTFSEIALPSLALAVTRKRACTGPTVGFV